MLESGANLFRFDRWKRNHVGSMPLRLFRPALWIGQLVPPGIGPILDLYLRGRDNLLFVVEPVELHGVDSPFEAKSTAHQSLLFVEPSQVHRLGGEA